MHSFIPRLAVIIPILLVLVSKELRAQSFPEFLVPGCESEMRLLNALAKTSGVPSNRCVSKFLAIAV